MSADTFVDTHILIYAHDLDAGDRQGRAAALLQGLWEERRGILTTQMLQEFYVNVTVKMPTPISLSAARGLLSTYAAWQVEVDGVETVLLATEIQERNRMSFWDAMIVAAAHRGGAAILLGEDLDHDQVIEGVRVQNPFLSP
jgi:predicted nucleic acid-binding protein